VEAAGNRRTARIVERLLDDSERARLVALRAGAASGGIRARHELQAVLAELQDGDGAKAAQLMAAAIGAFRDELVESLQRAALDMPLAAG
jgi:DNA-binding GntR family transcriptional regulator